MKQSSGGVRLRDVREWVSELEREYECHVTTLLRLTGGSTSAYTVYVVMQADFPSQGVLEPLQLQQRIPIELASTKPLVDRLFECVVKLTQQVEMHKQTKFWRRSAYNTPPS